MSEETAELEALLDLFEVHLDVPAEAIEIAHGTRAPFRVVGDENHHPPLPIHFHTRLDAPQLHPFVLSLQRDDLILDDVLIALGVVFDDPKFHVVLGPRHPPDAALVQVEEVVVIHVGLV